MASANLSLSSSSPALRFYHGNHNCGHHHRHENIAVSSSLNRDKHRKSISSNAPLPLQRRPISTVGFGHGSEALGLLGGSTGEDGDEEEEVKNLVEIAPSGIESGRVPPSVVRRLVRIQNSSNMFLRWLMTFPGFSERILADELFLAKVAMECGVGIVTKTTAEIERREDNFGNELDFVAADVIMALIADFMLVWLPAPTIPLGTAGPSSPSPSVAASFFYGCPDNAFQTESPGTSYSLSQRIGAVVRNGIKLFLIGTSASLIGTGLTDALIFVKKVTDKDYAGAAGDLPILQSSIGYGVYMAVSSNLRYQFLAGVVEQRILEPVLHDDKVMLSLLCFAFRTGNTFLGSLLWVDYARFIGIQ